MAGPQKYFDPSQPETLQIATLLLYLEAALVVLYLGFLSPFGIMRIAASAGGAYGMANGKKWGYALGIAYAVVDLLLLIEPAGLGYALRASTLALLFAVALLVLLVHPQSREYQKTWFK